ncbi:MAG: host-nuclease inhibitor Gam family protein [Patescibacteria group bacterium]
MAKRIKVTDDIYTIGTFDQADGHLGKLAELQRQKESLEAQADHMIVAVKDDLKRQSAPILEKINKHVRSLEVFCSVNRAAFGGRQSRKMLCGVMGWRKSTSIVTKKTTLEKIKDVFKSKAAGFLHVKESPDKDALAKLTDEQLADVDARRVLKEEFYAEPDLTRADTNGSR